MGGAVETPRMPSDAKAAGSVGGAEDLRTSTDEQIRSFFVASSHVAPIVNLIGGLVAVSLLWPHVPHSRLLAWFGVVVLLSGCQIAAALNPDAAIAQLSSRRLLLDTSVLTGIVWGMVPWLEISVFRGDEAYRWISLALAFAIGAGAMGGLSVLMGMALRVQVPLFTLVAAAFFAGGAPAVGFGVVVYLALMASDLHGTSRNLRQLINGRVEAADRAADAQTEARHDPLTGLFNRAGAFDRLERFRNGPPFVVMFVDLDHFKEVNDRLGHEAGDHVLVEAARRIENAMRPEDIVARLGGDEFLVVFESGGADVDEISRRVLAEVERPVKIGRDQAKISASIGLNVVVGNDWTASMLLREADHALYEAKRTGRQRIVQFDDRLADELEERTNLEGALRAAIRTGAIDVVAQPVVNMATDTFSSVELTPRWILPDGEEIPADVFIPLAQEVGLIDALTCSILVLAASARVQWRDHPVLGSAAVTVRVVASHLMRGQLVDDVRAIFLDHDLGPGELQLMLTETAAIQDPVFAAQSIESMREMGVGIVLGEFGSGKSSLRDLVQLPIDVVAVHPNLVHEAVNRPKLEKLLGALKYAAEAVGLSLAADGVDEPAHLEMVRRLDLPFAQGNALAPPQPLHEIANLERLKIHSS